MKQIKLSISVMAHPSREKHFDFLSEKLQIPVSEFCIDQQNNLLENSKRSWRAHDPNADFHVVVQDDAVPVDNFRERVITFITDQEERRIKEGRPEQGYNFFLKQDQRRTPLWPRDGAYHDNVTRAGIAICLPVKHIAPMLVEFDRQRSRHDDDRISEYCKKNGVKILFPVPSLVNHRIDQPSLANNPIGFEAWKMDGCEPVTIPKIIHQLWVGPHSRPTAWMDTWKEKHPGWEYRLWDNEAVFGRTWENQKHIDYFRARQMWPGVSDVCTYEILYEYGGFMPGADAVCLNAIDELFYNDYDSYSVWENEKIRPGLISPLHASVKGSVFARELIDELKNRVPNNVPWKSVGNAYMGEMFRKTKANVKIFPSHYFIPEHFLGEKYEGPDKIYTRQMWGSTTRCYTAGLEGRAQEGMTMIDTLHTLLDKAKGKRLVMLGDGHLDYIMKNLASVLALPGDVVELGCNVGVTSSYIKRFLTGIESAKELHVYDSFEGLPAKTAEDGATPCDKGASAVTVEQFKKTFADADVPLPVINKGFFCDIADEKYPAEICFAFFDGDFYGSIMDSFKKVYHKMVPGGIILIHDYEYAPFPGVKKACDDFLKDKPEVIVKNIFGIGKVVKV